MADDKLSAAGPPVPGFILASPTVPAERLARHLDRFLQQPNVFGLVERLEAIAWLTGSEAGNAQIFTATGNAQTGQPEQVAASDLLARWPRGRVFDQAIEWRWQPANGDFAILGLSEDIDLLTRTGGELASEEFAHAVSDGWQVFRAVHYLSGSTVGRHSAGMGANTWVETRYPQPLIYPVAHSGDSRLKPVLDVCAYADRNAAVRLTRFCGVRATSGSARR